jgi:serine protease Do
MKRNYIAGLGLLILAGLPLAAQKTVKVYRPSAAPVVADFEGPTAHSYLGVGVADLSSDRVQALKLKDDRGVEITQVDQDAPAGKAGLKEHDVIVTFNGTPVESQEQFKRLMRETPPGRTVSLDIMRDGQQQNVKVELADRKKLETSVYPHPPGDFAFAMPPMPPMPPMPDFPRVWGEQTITRVRSNSGATLESLTPQLGDYFGVKNGEGMLVRSVQKGSAAEAAGLRAGDVIVRVGDKKIADNSDWRDALRSNKDGKVAVVIVRDKKEQTISLSVPVRRGPDSSALYQEDCPEAEMALENAENAVEGVAPLVEESIENGMDAAAEALTSPEINEAMKKAMKELHHQLIDNRREINRNMAHSMKLASAQMKANRTEIERALRETQRNLEKIRFDFTTGMQ